MKGSTQLGIIAVALIGAALPDTTRAANGAGVGSTWQCTMPGGARVYSDGPCRGAAHVQRWSPRPIATGIRRTDGGGPMSVSFGVDFEPLLPVGRVDPFIDCRHRGGRYDLGGRVCHLPPGGTRTWTQAAD